VTAHPTSPAFKENAHNALADAQLQKALGNVRLNFIGRRAAAADRLPEFEALRDQARDIRDHVLRYLDVYLEIYERNVGMGSPLKLDRGPNALWTQGGLMYAIPFR